LYRQVAFRQAQLGSEVWSLNFRPFAVRASAEKLFPVQQREAIRDIGLRASAGSGPDIPWKTL
jgi:hypothetical protein